MMFNNLGKNKYLYIDVLLGIFLGATVVYTAVVPLWESEQVEETVVMNVHDLEYENGVVSFHREIFEPFEARWSVAILSSECHGEGIATYAPEEDQVQIFSLLEYVGDPNPEDCHLEEGEYVIVSHWDPIDPSMSEEFDISSIQITEPVQTEVEE